MAGNKEGGLRAAATNKERYGNDFFKRIGREGGRKGTTGGFAKNRQLAIDAGKKGGLSSRRGGIWKLSHESFGIKEFKTQRQAKDFITINNLLDYQLTHQI